MKFITTQVASSFAVCGCNRFKTFCSIGKTSLFASLVKDFLRNHSVASAIQRRQFNLQSHIRDLMTGFFSIVNFCQILSNMCSLGFGHLRSALKTAPFQAAAWYHMAMPRPDRSFGQIWQNGCITQYPQKPESA